MLTETPGLLFYARALAGDVITDWPLKCIAGTGGFLLSTAGGFDGAMNVLITLMCFDFALGFLRAWSANRISGLKIKGGVLKFLFYFAAIAVAYQLDQAQAQCINSTWFAVRDLMCMYLSVNEALSCLEHLAFFGVPLPDKLLSRLRTYRDSLSACTKK
ncbi:phage holin family protein [Desulfovibrio inopinatus]|uniref:phage holin family protein n=1 Tax=Desulfovibrio inopinatus TaxID=102109 RepID=UPI0003FF2A95|nr:phage holin family protein [Desulfovibrio inopinatus]